MEHPDDIEQESTETVDAAEDTTVFVAEADPPAPEDVAASAFDAAVAAEEPADEPAEEPADEPADVQQSLDDMVSGLRDDDAATPEAATDEPAELDAVAADGSAEPTSETAEEIGPDGATAEPASAIEGDARAHLLGRVPFYVIAGVWPVFSGVMTYLLWPASSDPFVGQPLYAGFVWGGAGLLAVGFLAAAIALAVLRAKTTPEQRQGLTRAVLLRATVVTTIGVACWWAGLLALDMHRLGRLG